ncbi:MAG: hypothetical protein ACYC0V_00600 [Armatimonadota bacterium]
MKSSNDRYCMHNHAAIMEALHELNDKYGYGIVDDYNRDKDALEGMVIVRVQHGSGMRMRKFRIDRANNTVYFAGHQKRSK